MKSPKAPFVVSLLAGLLALAQSGIGLFVHGEGNPFAFTSLHGESLQMYGRGIYAFDTYFKAPIQRGGDAVILAFCMPMLAAALYFYARGSLRGKIFLAGIDAFLLYTAASYAFGVAHNSIFILYIASFSASLFALILVVRSIDFEKLAAIANAPGSPGIPRGGIAALMFISAVGLLFAWLPDLIIALAENRAPVNLDSYTTQITDVLDLGIIMPCCLIAGFMILRRAATGYLLSAVLMIVLVIIAVTLTAQTVFQTQAGIVLTTAELIAKCGSFVVMGFFAVYLAARLLIGIREPASKKTRLARAGQH